MKHHDVMGIDIGTNCYGLNSGRNTPGYKAVKKVIIELTIEKLTGVGKSTNGHHKNESKNTTKSR